MRAQLNPNRCHRAKIKKLEQPAVPLNSPIVTAVSHLLLFGTTIRGSEAWSVDQKDTDTLINDHATWLQTQSLTTRPEIHQRTTPC